MQIKIILLSLAICLAGLCKGQPSKSGLGTAFIKTKGGSVEIIGLRNWTYEMIRDSIESESPGLEIGDAACGHVLRTRFGFPEAGVLRFNDGRTVITLVEPVDSSKVKLRDIPSERGGLIKEWAGFRKILDEDFIAVDFAVSTYLDRKNLEIFPDDVNEANVRKIWKFLSDRGNAYDLQLALETVNFDTDPGDRMVAINILMNFHEQDICWHALVKGLRDPDWDVKGQALGIIRTLRGSSARTIDWSPVSEDLRYLLGGTTIVYHTEVIKTLLDTGVAVELAPVLLNNGAELLIAELSSRHEYVQQPALQLMVHFAGQDLGTNPESWLKWMDDIYMK